jgi:hypothetical protein
MPSGPFFCIPWHTWSSWHRVSSPQRPIPEQAQARIAANLTYGEESAANYQAREHVAFAHYQDSGGLLGTPPGLALASPRLASPYHPPCPWRTVAQKFPNPCFAPKPSIFPWLFLEEAQPYELEIVKVRPDELPKQVRFRGFHLLPWHGGARDNVASAVFVSSGRIDDGPIASLPSRSLGSEAAREKPSPQG